MGVINMAHGEMVMIGAYTTFVVQQAIRCPPGLIDAVPVHRPSHAAFIVTGAIGIAIERGVIRFLYGRPLETLLATWGVSLDAAAGGALDLRPANREVTTPSWMSGSWRMAHLRSPTNRLFHHRLRLPGLRRD
jgi:urea transport system permease protein